MTAIKKGDIVKHEESPCEVLTVQAVGKSVIVFILNKRTLNGSFLLETEVEFVRRPSSTEFKRK